MTFVRRRFCALVGSVIAGTIGSSLACAQTDNVTPLRFVVPCAVGSPADTVARALAQILTKDLGRNVYVDNLPATDISPVSPGPEAKSSTLPSDATLGCGE